MGPNEIAFAKAMVFLFLFAGTGLTFYSIRLRHKSHANPQLENDLQDQLDEEMRRRAALESRLAELEERVDFTERRLVQKGRPELPATTPV